MHVLLVAYHRTERCEFESCSGEAYSIQHYGIKFVSDLRQVSGILWVLRFPPLTQEAQLVINYQFISQLKVIFDTKTNVFSKIEKYIVIPNLKCRKIFKYMYKFIVEIKN
jgi:hypothetical protein